MIVYHPQFDLCLKDCGIDVPLEDERARKTFEALQKIDLSLSHFPIDQIKLLTKEDLLRVHTQSYIEALNGDQLITKIKQAFERPLANLNEAQAQKLWKTILLQASATAKACELALAAPAGWSGLLAGGMHHAYPETGRGFCLIHDITIALKKLRAEGKIKTAWVIDIDAHKGDGTALIARDLPWVKTLSLHMGDSWPFTDQDYHDVPSTLDLEVRTGEEHRYLELLQQGLKYLGSTSTAVDLVIVVAGADVWEHDQLPSTQGLRLTLEQILERDQLVFRFFQERGIPQTYLIAGGYGSESDKVYTQFYSWLMSLDQ